jgi:hypothetical protein
MLCPVSVEDSEKTADLFMKLFVNVGRIIIPIVSGVGAVTDCRWLNTSGIAGDAGTADFEILMTGMDALFAKLLTAGNRLLNVNGCRNF